MASLPASLQTAGWLVVAMLAVTAAPAFAADLQDPTASFDGLLQLVQQTSAAWGPKLQGYAMKLFWLLATIQFTWSLGMLAFKGADFGELFGELFRQIMVIGFWLAFLMFSVEWNTAIVESFREAGAAAAGSSKSLIPSDMFTLAVEFATKIAQSGAGMVSPLNPFAQVLTSISAIIVLLCFAFIAVLMAVALFESYIVINAGVMMMGFAGSSWTRDMTMQFLKYGVSVGAKLFVLSLLVGLISQASNSWADAYQPMSADGSSTFTLLGLALCCAYCCKTIPELIQGVIAGVSPGGGGAIGGMAAAGIAAAAATAAVAKTIATGGLAAPAAAGAAANAASSAGSAAGMGAGQTLTGTGGAAAEGAGGGMAELGEGVGRGGAAAGEAADGAGGGDVGDVGEEQGNGDDANDAGDEGDAGDAGDGGGDPGEGAAGPAAANDEDYNSGVDMQDELTGSEDADGATTDGSTGEQAAGQTSEAENGENDNALGEMFEGGDSAAGAEGAPDAQASDLGAGAGAESGGEESGAAAGIETQTPGQRAGAGKGGKDDGLGGMFEAARHVGRGAYAAAAMVTPGMDTSPSADGLATGPGNLKGEKEQEADADLGTSSMPMPENVIKPESQTEGKDPSDGGKSSSSKPPSHD